MKGLAVVLAALVCAWPAAAGAPRPAKAVAAGLFSGRWYEIARTPNLNQIDCEGATSDFAHWSGGAFAVTQTCHRGAAVGPARTFKADGRVLPGSGNARMKLAFFGGLLSQEYWILDHADDDGWAIMATPGGHYVWLLARRPALDAATRARALGRVAALGYDLKKLAFPQQAAR
jgi:apolipoprotein D and lipocalin family protein